MRSTDRLICILKSVNATAIDNDGGKPGQFLAEICHEAAQQLEAYQTIQAARIRDIEETIFDGHNPGDHGC